MRVNGVIIIWAVPRKPESASKVNVPCASVINPPLLLDHKKSRRGVMRKHPLPSSIQIATSSALYFWTDLTTCVHLVAQLCLTFCDPWTIAPQAPLSKGILQTKILEWVAMPSSRGSSQPRNWTQISHIAGGFFTVWAKQCRCQMPESCTLESEIQPCFPYGFLGCLPVTTL